MPYIFQSNLGITPTVLEIPYSSPTDEQIIRYLSSGGIRLEVNGAIRQSISRQDQGMQAIMGVRACMAVAPLTERNKNASPPDSKELPLICDERYIHGANQAILIVATVGGGVEEKCAQLHKRGEYIDALVVDSIASAALDNAIWEIKKDLISKTENLQVGYTLFPGINSMPLGFQRTIFEILKPEKPIGVLLAESMLLVPIKSISAVIPMGYKLSCLGLKVDDSMLYAMGDSSSY
ncbi:MAG: hypothetical protein JRJ86_15050 [Deltaproteobacteria bacterium]|nr:hypothetical protein [Deltaproteobacteria bacterium]